MVVQHVSQVRGRLRQYIVENFLYMQQERLFSDDDSFLRFGIIDSLGILEIVAFVEEQWNVDVELPGITEANFGSISAIASYVASRLVSSEVSLGAA